MELNHTSNHSGRLSMLGTMYRKGIFSDRPVKEVNPRVCNAILSACPSDFGPRGGGNYSHIKAIQSAFADTGLHIEARNSENTHTICSETDITASLHSLCTKILAFTGKYPAYYQDFQTEEQCMNALRKFAESVQHSGCVFTHCS